MTLVVLFAVHFPITCLWQRWTHAPSDMIQLDIIAKMFFDSDWEVSSGLWQGLSQFSLRYPVKAHIRRSHIKRTVTHQTCLALWNGVRKSHGLEVNCIIRGWKEREGGGGFRESSYSGRSKLFGGRTHPWLWPCPGFRPTAFTRWCYLALYNRRLCLRL